MSTTSWYGKIGTTEVVVTMDELASTLGKEYVKMERTIPPDDGRFYVVSPDGSWELSMDNDAIRAERQKRYLEAWPVAKQLEAQQDLTNGDATKWNEMQMDFKRIKEELPYVKHVNLD